LVLIIDGDAVEQVEYDLREIVADPIVREDVELWYDLVDVLVHAAADRGLCKAVLSGVLGDGVPDDRIFGECGLRGTTLLEMVARQSGAELVDRAEGPAPEPPGHAGPPP